MQSVRRHENGNLKEDHQVGRAISTSLRFTPGRMREPSASAGPEIVLGTASVRLEPGAPASRIASH